MSKRRNYKKELRELKEIIKWKQEVNALYQQKGVGLLICRKFNAFDELKEELNCVKDHIKTVLDMV